MPFKKTIEKVLMTYFMGEENKNKQFHNIIKL